MFNKVVTLTELLNCYKMELDNQSNGDILGVSSPFF